MRSLILGLVLSLSAAAFAQAPPAGRTNAGTQQKLTSVQGATPLRIPGQKLAPPPTPRPPQTPVPCAGLRAEWMD